MDARAGADVHEVVGGAHGVLVVLDDHHRVAEVAQLFQRGDQLVVVALVQADARLVEDVEHADERRADLRRQPDALRLAARERPRAAREVEVFEADADEKAEACADLLDNLGGNLPVLVVQLQLRDEVEHFVDRHEAELIDVLAAHRDRQHHLVQAAAPAFGADLLLEQAVVVLLPVGLAAAVNHRDDALKRRGLVVRRAAEIARYCVGFLPRAVE